MSGVRQNTDSAFVQFDSVDLDNIDSLAEIHQRITCAFTEVRVNLTMASNQESPEPIFGSKEVGAIAHLYRAEVYRSTTWRQRLDQTTNWAVISTGIGLSVAFAGASASSFPIVLVGIMCAVFLVLEARRYRYFYVWKFRARLLELEFYVPMLRGEGARIPLDRGPALSNDYDSPSHRISMGRAIGRRLRRNYGWIFSILGVAYFAKIAIHPQDTNSWSEFIHRASIGPIPGWVSIVAGLLFHAGWIYIAWSTWRVEQRDKSKTGDVLNPTLNEDLGDDEDLDETKSE